MPRRRFRKAKTPVSLEGKSTQVEILIQRNEDFIVREEMSSRLTRDSDTPGLQNIQSRGHHFSVLLPWLRFYPPLRMSGQSSVKDLLSLRRGSEDPSNALSYSHTASCASTTWRNGLNIVLHIFAASILLLQITVVFANHRFIMLVERKVGESECIM